MRACMRGPKAVAEDHSLAVFDPSIDRPIFLPTVQYNASAPMSDWEVGKREIVIGEEIGRGLKLYK